MVAHLCVSFGHFLTQEAGRSCRGVVGFRPSGSPAPAENLPPAVKGEIFMVSACSAMSPARPGGSLTFREDVWVSAIIGLRQAHGPPGTMGQTEGGAAAAAHRRRDLGGTWEVVPTPSASRPSSLSRGAHGECSQQSPGEANVAPSSRAAVRGPTDRTPACRECRGGGGTLSPSACACPAAPTETWRGPRA